MAPRPETRREAEAFRAHLEERSTADRHRLLAEHRAFLSGERQNDAAFGDETRNTSAERPERVPASGIHLPPTGKTVAYTEAAKQRMADRQAEKAAAKKNTAAKNKGGRSSKTKTSTPKRYVEFMNTHVVDTTAEEDDLITPDESSVGLPGSRLLQRKYRLLTLQMGLAHGRDFNDEALNSDLDGGDGADLDEWYIETETGTKLNTPSGVIDATASLTQRVFLKNLKKSLTKHLQRKVIDLWMELF
ncbi:hypothetical protein PInf_017156 [Phytophthora infestans]|nr:hypothetical protein PInf_017156 [Phytophthora infestans]